MAGDAINDGTALADEQDVTRWESAEEQCRQWGAQGFHMGGVSRPDGDGGLQGGLVVGERKCEADAGIEWGVGAIPLCNPGRPGGKGGGI